MAGESLPLLAFCQGSFSEFDLTVENGMEFTLSAAEWAVPIGQRPIPE
ncbi:MAG: hypothetical protein ACR2OU_19250 [Thermomicrobiales bacterium]